MKLLLLAWNFLKKDFEKWSFIYVFVLATICIIASYQYDLYDTYIHSSFKIGKAWLVLPAYYLFFYYLGAVPILLMRHREDILKNPVFWFKSFFYISIFGTSIGYNDFYNWSFPSLLSSERLFILRCLYFAKTTFGPLLFLIIAKLTFDRKLDNFYGIARSSAYIKSYLWLVALLLPFVVLASFTADFQTMYPIFRPWNFEVFGMPDWMETLVFDSAYSFHYIGTELVMRGCLVVAMVSIMGKDAVLPMAFMYCVLHLGKPIGEQITSIFGGYILGAFAYETKHIWGGIILHLAIALGIDAAGIIQHYFNQ